MASEGNKPKKQTSRSSTSRSTKQSTQASSRGQRRTPTKSKKSNAKKNEAQYELQNEIILMVALVVSVLLLLSDFGLGGAAGNAVNGVMFGLFGVLAYLFPVLLFLGVAFFLANRGNKSLPMKIVYLAGMFLMLLAFAELLTDYLPSQWEATKEHPYLKPNEYFDLAKQYKKGGGFFGGLLCFLFLPLFGKAGSYVIIVALFLICFMLFSRKALFAFVARKWKDRSALHKAHSLERQELYEERRVEREKLVEEKRKELAKQRARTYLLSEEEKQQLNVDSKSNPDILQQKNVEDKKKKEKPSKNFFGGTTPTGDFLYGNEYKLPEETVDEVNSFYHAEQKSQTKRKRQDNPVLPIVQIDETTGEYKGSTYVERKKEPTVAEQLMAMGGPSDRATSGGQALWESDQKEPQAEENAPSIGSEAFGNVRARRSNGSPKEEGTPSGPRTVQKKSDASQGSGEIVSMPANGEAEPPKKKYIFPKTDLLTKPKGAKTTSERDLRETAMKLQSTLDSFGVHVTVTNVSCGPAVTRYELLPEQGVKVSKITSLADDIKLNLAAADVRIEAPIPGKAAVGIEVPNKENSMVLLRELLESSEFESHPSKVAFAVGKDIGGQTIVTDIARMPHLLIAGATGSGKSVCINTLIMSIIYKADPAEVKLIMVDPKVVELSVYNGIPHLMIPVVTDPKKASAALNWAVMEMTERYQKFADLSVRDLKGYNERVDEAAKDGLLEEKYQHLPQIIIIVDELADLMMVAPGEVEDSICRLAQLARAAGLHLVIATQRPSVNVITGLIKANIPSRIAFAVSSAIDSRTILDGSGAEKLLGKGDMLFFPSGYAKPVRVQGAFVSDHEVSAVVDFLKQQNETATYSTEVTEKITGMPGPATDNGGNSSGYDEFFEDAGKLIIEKEKASIGMLQRAYKIGFNRAARIMDQLCEAGVVGPEEGTKPRKILMTAEEFASYLS